VVDGLEEEAGTVTDDAEEAGDRRRQVGQHLAPHRHDGVVAGEGSELVAAGVHVTSTPSA
jgi:hypothetical protein